MPGYTRHPASFRDPSGFMFTANGKIYRQVNKIYAEHYNHFINSGLYQSLQDKQLILPHIELKENILNSENWYLTLLPEKISFISYPYEWCFEQLKDAALLTLQLVKLSVEKGMILKDATAFNIQFQKGSPVFIDTLSFEKYDATHPWVAYRQFCENFLFPLWLGHYHKINFQNILSIYPEGIPVEIAAKLFPAKSRLNLGVWLHVRLQNKLSKRVNRDKTVTSFSKKKLLNLITHLEGIIRGLDNTNKTTWSNYYDESISSPEYLKEKEKIVRDLLSDIHGKKVLDLGANEGIFSRIAAEKGFDVVATDNDEQCINNLYKQTKKQNLTNSLPLCIDITNPAPAIGFANRERASWNDRMRPDLVMALALIHHLVIGKNIPLPMLAEYLNQFAPQLLIEFVPQEDEKTQLLLQNKKNIYPEYTKDQFENIFQTYFTIIKKQPVAGTGRWIYLMKRKIKE